MTTDARFRDTLKSLLAAVGSSDPTRRQKARRIIRDTLAVNQRSWNDLITSFQFRGQHSDKLKKLFAMLGQDNDGEFDNARQKISDLLARERGTWKAFVDSLFSTSSNAWSDWRDHAASDPAINPLDLVHHLLWRYLEMTPHQFVAVSLWIAHTFVYQRFTVTPRLMVTSPVRGCGKTTLLDLLEALCVRPLKSDSITAASIYHAVDREHPTLLIDEADNLGLAFNGALRAVLNSGHRRGGKVTRYHGGQARSFATFAPTYAEVAHEAIFRRWDKLRDWIAAEREFLAWRSGLESARRAWQAIPAGSKDDALLMGHGLVQASNWLTRRAEDISPADREFVVVSRKVAQRRKLRVQALFGALVVAIIAGLAAWRYEQPLKEHIYWFTDVRSHVLTAAQERALKPGDPFFKECTDCPEMIIVPAGNFTMGSPATEKGREDNESPQHMVTIGKPFAVARFELTFDEWEACAAHGDCDAHISASGWGRGRQPVINVSWNDAQDFVAWLSRETQKKFRLPTETEWEYAARAGTQTKYWWGDQFQPDMANCKGCGGTYDPAKPLKVGSFKPNPFGLYDMGGSVDQWVEDCWHKDYQGAPVDGSAWVDKTCTSRVIRSGSWKNDHSYTRPANRDRYEINVRYPTHGLRIAISP